MPVIPDAEIAAAARAAGFTDIATAVAIALAESGGDPTKRPRNSNGSYDHGLWQINSVHRDILTRGNWQNPTDNARMAKAVYDDAKGWTPWVVYKTQKYRLFLPRGTAVAGTAATISTGTPSEDINDTAAFIETVSSPGTWQRIGYFVGGGVLLLYGLAKITGDNQLSDTTKRALVNVATRGAGKAVSKAAT
jgi:hypothetical protein